MPAGAHSGAKRLFLLCALALGVILMHHVNAPGAMSGTAETVVVHAEPAAATIPDTGSASPHHACPPCGAHVMTYVCLAILDGMPLILLALVTLAALSGPGATTAAGLRDAPRPSRPPDLHGRAALTSLCVWRV